MTAAATTFAKLLHPMEPQTFLSDFYGRKALHLPGKPSKVRGISSWNEFAALLGMTAVWTSETLKLVLDGKTLDGESYCEPVLGRDNQRVLRPDGARVQAHIAEGASLVADLVETLSPGIRNAATALEMGLGAYVTCNAYMSQQSRRAFPSHFDTMEVFALQIEGRKVWRIYEGRFENPIEKPGYSYPYFSQAYHERVKGNVAFEVEMQPGDLLYIPAGVYHDALASSAACLHLSFGLTRPTALDYMTWLTRSLDDFAEFREPLPDYADAASVEAHLEAAEARLAELLRMGAARKQFIAEQQRLAHPLHPVPSLPPATADETYRVVPAKVSPRDDGAALSVAGEELPLTPEEAPVARWLAERDLVNACEIGQRFRKTDAAELTRVIERLTDMRLLIPL